MREKDFQSKFTRWAEHNLRHSGAFELKLTKGKSIPFTAVADHQKDALLHVKCTQIGYKIPDVGMGQKPFDFFILRKEHAYVVCMFYTRGCKTFYMIDIENWISEENFNTRKSLTEDRAKEIGFTCALG